MTINAESVEDYFSKIPPERKEVLEKIHRVFADHIPDGFEEALSFGMPGFVVPHSIYPAGYHTNPEEPLPFVSYASQKNYIALYHGGVYAIPRLKDWFEAEYARRAAGKLNMGKSCIRFSNLKKIPYDLLGELASRVTVEEWIKVYEGGRSSAGG